MSTASTETNSSSEIETQYSFLTSLLLKIYSKIKSSGLLEIPPIKRLFLEAYFLYKRLLEDPFYNLSKKHPELFKDGIILDIGANCGYTSKVFAKLTDKVVYAFEPDPDNLSMLSDVIKRASLGEKIISIPAAVGAEDGTLQFWRNKDHHADHRIATDQFINNAKDRSQIISVPVVSIDNFLSKNCPDSRVSFIKMDVQGFETQVCKGLEKTVSNHPQLTLAIEFCPTQIKELGFDPDFLLNFFTTRGFTWKIIEQNGELTEFNQKDLSNRLSGRGYIDLLATRLSIS